MSVIRAAELSDLRAMVDLMVSDAEDRSAKNPGLWKVDSDAHGKATASLRAALDDDAPPFRQQWLVAEGEGEIIGLTHSILLPVPPIYAGEFGPPGLIMEDCCLAKGAPDGTTEALLAAAEADLVSAGAEILLASSVAGGDWAEAYAARDYAPLTLYYAKTGLSAGAPSRAVRRAHEGDVPGIVDLSAVNRKVLCELNDFWKPHTDANARFGNWMKRSLTLADRDMLVAEAGGQITGYAIAQPASALHFPAAHDIGQTGFVDDYFHAATADPAKPAGPGAAVLLAAAEAALAARGNTAALIVCPAAWASKIAVLQKAGYEPAITWYIKR